MGLISWATISWDKYNKELGNNERVEDFCLREYYYILHAIAAYIPCREKSVLWALPLKIFCWLFLIYYFIAFAITAAFGYEDFEIMATGIHFSIILLLGICIQGCALFYYPKIIKILKMSEEGVYNYEEEPEKELEIYEAERLKYRRRVITIWTPYLCMVASMAILGSPLVDYLVGTLETNKPALNGIARNLPIPIFTPHSTTTSLGYMVAFLAEVIVASVFMCTLLAGNYIFLLSNKFLGVQLQIMTLKIRNLEKRAKALFSKRYYNADDCFDLYRNNSFLQCCEECLNKCFIHHQKIYVYHSNFARLIQPVFFMVYISGGGMVALAGFALLNSNDKIGFQVTSVLLCISEIFNLGLLSYFSEQTASLNEDLRNELYFIKWYNLNIRSQKSILLALLRTQKSMILSALLADMDLNAFGGMLNTAYSYMNLLIASK